MLVTMIRPTCSEDGSYERAPILLEWTKEYIAQYGGTVNAVWKPEQGSVIASTVKARALLDEVPVGDWIAPDASGRYLADYGVLAQGHYLLGLEFDTNVGATVLAKSVVVNPENNPSWTNNDQWSAINRFQTRYGPHKYKQVRSPYVPNQPKAYKLKARVAQPYGHRPASRDLWVHTIGLNNGATVTPGWAMSTTGAIVRENLQKYFYQQATTLAQNPPYHFEIPDIALYDGPRGVGTIGHAYNVIVRRGRRGYYISDTSGRVAYMSMDGKVTTLAGCRVKNGQLKYHSGMVRTDFQLKLKTGDAERFRALYDSAWEIVGDWSRVSGSKTPLEPWKLTVAMRNPDGSIDTRDGHEFWWADTLNHRILFLDHWTAHAPDHYEPPHFPPAGYVQPEQPTGQTTVVDFLATENGLPSAHLNEPWAQDIHKPTERFYWCNFGNDSIWSCKMDGTDIRPFHIGNAHPTYPQLGAAKRLWPIDLDRTNTNRSLYLQDGTISSMGGSASLIKPQGLVFSHDGRFMFVAERYTYVIRRIDMETGEIKTIWLFPKVGFGSTSAATTDISLDIDTEGTCGPQDDLFLSSWRGNYRVSADGTHHQTIMELGGICQLANGPLNLAHPADYHWTVSPGDGEIVVFGNAAGFQQLHITLKQSTDPVPNMDMWFGGQWLFLQTLDVDHGPHGLGRIGKMTMEDLGALTDAEILSYWHANAGEAIDWSLGNAPGTSYHFNARTKLIQQGVTPDQAFIYYVRWQTRDIDYAASVPVPVNCTKEWREEVGEWGPCVDGMRSRTIRRYEVVTVPESNGGTCSPPQEEFVVETEPCVVTCEEQLAAAQETITALQAENAALEAKIDAAQDALD